MPSIKQLKVGSLIRLLKVPAADIAQRKREIAQAIPNPGWTAMVIECIIQQQPVVQINSIDEYGNPWFFCEIVINANREGHAIAIMDEDSWVPVDRVGED